MEDLHKKFINDFKELLNKYDAEFNVEFESEGWSHRDVPTIIFNWNENRGCIEDLKLPRYIDKH